MWSCCPIGPTPARAAFRELPPGAEDAGGSARAASDHASTGSTPSSPSSVRTRARISFFATADSVLGLYPFDALAADANALAGAGPQPGTAALAINVESEAEVERVLAEAVAAGASLAKAAVKSDWGGYSGYFADPDGHLWEVAHNPFLPLDEHGSVVLPE